MCVPRPVGPEWMCPAENHMCQRAARARFHSVYKIPHKSTKPTTATTIAASPASPANCKPLQCGFNRNKIIVVCNGECVCHSFVCVRLNMKWKLNLRAPKTQNCFLEPKSVHTDSLTYTTHIQPPIFICTILVLGPNLSLQSVCMAGQGQCAQ